MEVDFCNYSVAILAGGQGKRIQEINSELPKPLIPIAGKPVLFHQLDFLLQYKFKAIYILVGYKGYLIKNVIEKYYASHNIIVIHEDKQLGTAGCLSLIKNSLQSKYLIVISGDLIFDIDMQDLCHFHEKNESICTLTVHSNFHPRDADLIVYNKADCRIQKLLLRPHTKNMQYSNAVNAAISIVSSNCLNKIEYNVPANFESDFVLKLLEGQEHVFAYPSIEYIYDMGTPERYYQVEKDLFNKIPATKKKATPKSAIMLDLNLVHSFLTLELAEIVQYFGDKISKINHLSFCIIGFYNEKVPNQFVLEIETFLGDFHSAKLDAIIPLQSNLLDNLFSYLNHFNVNLEKSYFISGRCDFNEYRHFTTIQDFLSSL